MKFNLKTLKFWDDLFGKKRNKKKEIRLGIIFSTEIAEQIKGVRKIEIKKSNER